jgi:hypothetical protein
MERRAFTTVAAAALTVAAAAIVVQTTDAGNRASVAAAHLPGTVAGPERTAQAGASRLLRPDMFSLRARDLTMSVNGDGFRVLRFAAMLADAGPGPMVVKPRPRADCPPGQRLARQLIHLDRNRDGRYQRRIDTAVRSRKAGCMLDHPTHDHWHYDAMAAYRLVDPAPRRRFVVGRPKVSFCLRDNQPIPGTRPRQQRAFFGDCGRNLVQGISPGWVDLYDASLPGQSLRVPPRLSDGVYCLVLRADPRDQLVETNETNNARARPVRLHGNTMTTPQTRACRGLVR